MSTVHAQTDPAALVQFLTNARAQLLAAPSPDAAVQMLRIAAEQCLGAAAEELLHLPVLADHPQRAMLHEAVAQLPSGVVPWNRDTTTFANNLTLLRRTNGELAARASAYDLEARGLERMQTRSGTWLLTQRQQGGPRKWCRSLTNLARPELPVRGELGPVLTLGLRDTPLWTEILDRTEALFLTYSHPVFCVEPDLASFVAWMYLAPQERLLSDPRVKLLVGPDAVDQLQGLLTSRTGLQLPSTVVNFGLGDALADATKQAISTADGIRTQRLKASAYALERRYAERDAAYWAERHQRPGRVLAVTSRYTTMLQHSARDTMAAFARHGWETQTYMENTDHERFSGLDLCEHLLAYDPDLVVQLDHLRYEWPLWPENLPLLSWIQDPMPNLLSQKAGASIGPYDFVCGYFKKRCVEEFGYPAERFTPTVIPVSDRIFHNEPSSAEDAARYECDVVFVSNASDTIEQIHQAFLQGNPNELRPLLNTVYERVRQLLLEGAYLSPHEDATELVRSVMDELNITLEPEVFERLKNDYAYRIYDRGRRHETLNWVANWARSTGRSLRIYGNGWDRHPTLADFAHGPIAHGEPLRSALRNARLALQLIPAGFRHQRTYEALAAGTLPLTRYCATDFDDLSIKDFLAERAQGLPTRTPHASAFPDLHRVTFNTAEEFAARAEQYLGDDAERHRMCETYRAIVLEKHTYSAVVGQLLGEIQAGLQANCQQPVTV